MSTTHKLRGSARSLMTNFKYEIESIFPNTGTWDQSVEKILSNKYPPEKSSYNPTNDSLLRDGNIDFRNSSIWDLFCEEVVDTEHTHIFYQKLIEEIKSRGMSDIEIYQTRKFVWLTAGWMNFEKKVWDWVSITEEDIVRAIEWQNEDKLIDLDQKAKMLEYIGCIKIEFDKNTQQIDILKNYN
jgi:hypothetical protein